MRAISIMQPWAWAIADGHKRVENRRWCLPKGVQGQRVAIHASMSDAELLDPAVRTFFRKAGLDGWPKTAEEQRGCVIATGVFARCVHHSDVPPESRWYVGPHGFWLSSVQRLPEPVRCRGSLGFFRLTSDVEAKVIEQEAARGR
jgi:hypothetical protein